MKKRLFSIVLTLCMVISLMPGFTPAAGAAVTVWDGSISTFLTVVDITAPYNKDTNPLAISSSADLAYLTEQVFAAANLVTYTDSTGAGKTTAARAAGYKLTADIVLNTWADDGDGVVESAELKNNAGAAARAWRPIGTNGKAFTGVFDGGGHTVSGIYCNGGNYRGFFGWIDTPATVKNVGVEDSYIAGTSGIGGVVGYSSGTATVQNCYNTGSVNGSADPGYIGGVVGYLVRGTVVNCYNTGSVTGSSTVGGVVGYGSDATTQIQYCYNTGSITGSSNKIGGVVGESNGAVKYCYNAGVVSGVSYTGGVAGTMAGAIENCYNKGSVTGSGSGNGYVGGVAGSAGTIKFCYNSGSVTAPAAAEATTPAARRRASRLRK
ncbi:MAG: hypothetical protein HPY50_00930 [Firmicutes bacterium]|nr:hypothetical protein [Bacillota bacterium]